MKHVLIITGPLAGHGGEETLLKTVITELTKTMHVSLLISDLQGDLDWLGPESKRLNVIALPHAISRARKMLGLVSSIRRANADTVICMTPRMLLMVHLAMNLMRRKARLISWLQFSVTDKFSPRTVKLLHLADAHMVLSAAMAKQLEQLSVPRKDIHVVFNPIPRQSRVIHATAKGKTTFICMARIQYAGEKNLQELFNALSGLKGEWQLELFGSDDSNDQLETKKCRDLIERLGIQSRIHWRGFVRNAWQQIVDADALVLTSTYEGFGLVLAESASYGLPVVSSDCPVGPREIVNVDNGVLYPLGKVSTLTAELQRFIDRQHTYQSDKVKASVKRYYLDQYMSQFIGVIER